MDSKPAFRPDVYEVKVADLVAVEFTPDKAVAHRVYASVTAHQKQIVRIDSRGKRHVIEQTGY